MSYRKDLTGSVCVCVWTKLQNLPQANSLELGAFFIIILFVGESRHFPRP
uniref:Uncharacterized protein n=1 Tax=Oncorhynchus mykiss TaxID=8022 RepID=A0A8C7QXJ5_ONCMY